MIFNHSVILAITGASGTLYAFRLLEYLVKSNSEVFLLISDAAFDVARIETNLTLPMQKEDLEKYFQQQFQAKNNQIRFYTQKEWTSPVASGNSTPRAMVICPASMGTLSSIAIGSSNNLIERAADVTLKERRQLICVPRETPYSTIHLHNMLTLTKMGALIMPASPGFYHNPKTINSLVDFMVSKILQHLKIPQQLIDQWGK